MEAIDISNLEHFNEVGANSEAQSWAKKIFEKSPLKQRKLRMLKKFLRLTSTDRCLDLGSDNGAISLYLRELGGEWYSADLNQETVDLISSVVGERVFRFDGLKLNFPDHYFDHILIVDFLEHIHHDKECISELARVLKPGGSLIVNVPNPQEGVVRKLRFALGQTDEVHGHLRSGYDVNELNALLKSNFYLTEYRSYGKFFSEIADTLITAAVYFLKGKKHSSKGAVVSGADLAKSQKTFKLYKLIYPFLSLMVKLDEWLFFMSGNMLIVNARKFEL